MTLDTLISPLPIELRRHIFKFVRHPIAMLFLSTPRVPLRHVYDTHDEPTSHFIRCYDADEDKLCFGDDFKTQEWNDEYDSQFSRSRQPPTRFREWNHTKMGLYAFMVCAQRMLKANASL
jgi:hypothetical protein